MFRRAAPHEFETDIESRAPGLPFRAAFRIVASARRRQHAHEAAACLVRRTVEMVCGHHRVRAVVAAQQEAQSALGLLVGRRDGDVLLHAANVQLTVRPDVLRVAVEHDRAVAEHDRADELLHREIARARRFRDEVLEDRSMALAYWAMVHRDDLNRDTLDEVVQTVERVAEQERDEVPWRRAAKILTDFVDGLDAADRSTLLLVLGRYAAQFSDVHAASQLTEVATSLRDSEAFSRGESG